MAEYCRVRLEYVSQQDAVISVVPLRKLLALGSRDFRPVCQEINLLGELDDLAFLYSRIRSTAGFTIFPTFVALVHKKLYVGHYLSCRRFGEEPPRRPLTRPHLPSVSLFFIPCHFFLKRTAHHDGQRLWPLLSPMVLPPPMRSLPLHHHTIGDAPYARFCRNRRGGRELTTVPPTPFWRFYALRQPSTDLAGRNRTWRCHPRCDRCRFIHTPWATPPTFGFVGIDGGGE